MADNDERRRPGRPSGYKEEYSDQVRRLALLGLTDDEMAAYFEVSRQTLYNWDEAHPEFFDARARGKLHADGRVAEKLYHRALGYHHPEVHVSTYEGEVTLTPLVKYYPPDTQAATLWLTNRHGGKWKAKPAPDEADRGTTIIIRGGLPSDADS